MDSTKRCEKCGIETQALWTHHVKPRVLGGTDDDGLMRLCLNCHDDEHGGACGGSALSHTPEVEAKRMAAIRAFWDNPANHERRAAAVRLQHAQGKRKHVGALVSAWHVNNPDLNAERIRKISETKRDGLWARGYASCVDCHRTDRKHASHGRCWRCYQAYKRRLS